MSKLLILLLFFGTQVVTAQFGPMFRESSDWGDYDNDGDLDLLLSFNDESFDGTTAVYRNDNGSINTTPVKSIAQAGKAQWIDHDRDGNLDFILGSTVYLNQGGTFNNTSAGQPGIRGDYDRDGDLDILDGSTIYENLNNSDFQSMELDQSSAFADERSGWIDFDNDGDLDVLLTGNDPDAEMIAVSDGQTSLFRNDFGVFNVVSSGITGYADGAFDWGDYDQDGFMDLLITGIEFVDDNFPPNKDLSVKIYNNSNGTFVNVFTLDGLVSNGDVRWADIDVDGDLDALVTGFGSATFSAAAGIIKNNSGSFSLSAENLPVTNWSRNALDIIDKENDGNLEVYTGDDFGTGTGGPANYSFVDFANDQPNTAPTTPTGLTAATSIGAVRLRWDQASDNETQGLYYNIHVRTASETIIDGFSNTDGRRKMLNFGNVGPQREIGLELPNGTYFWSIQTIDNGFMSSPFSVEFSFTISNPINEVFSTSASGLTNVEWGDMNGDNKLDLVVSDAGSVTAHIYDNENFNTAIPVTSTQGGDFQILDFNKDGFNDILFITEIFLNENGSSFNDSKLILPNTGEGIWSDVNEDGDLDLFVIGELETFFSTANNFINEPTGFAREDITTLIDVLSGMVLSSGSGILPVTITDIISFNDSYVIAGSEFWEDPNYDFTNHITVYGEEGGYDTSKPVFTNDNFSQIDYGDYDNDGDYDILVSASSEAGVLIRKNEATYSSVVVDDTTTGLSSLFGDFDNDGSLDIVSSTGDGMKIYLNRGGSFEDSNTDFGGIDVTDFSLGDYDRDGDLDVAVVGTFGIKVFENTIGLSNEAPNAPNSLNTMVDGDEANLSWDDGADAETPSDALQYNLQVNLNDQSLVVSHSNINGDISLGDYNNLSMANSFTLTEIVHGKYGWKVQAIDHGNLGSPFSMEQVFFINEMPTDIQITALTTSEDATSGQVVATFSTTDPDIGETFNYNLIESENNDNSAFSIEGNELRSVGVFDFETKSELTIKVESFDNLDGTISEEFVITLIDANDAPTDIVLDNSAFSENLAVGTEITSITSTDQDTGDTHTYQLAEGAGDADNDLFEINDSNLATNSVFDFESKTSYTIRLQSTDVAGGVFSKSFNLTLVDANDAPTDISLSSSEIVENQVVGTIVGVLNGVDIDDGETFSFSLPQNPNFVDNAIFSIQGNDLRSAAIFTLAKTDYNINVRVTDSGGLTFEKEFSITVIPGQSDTNLAIRSLVFNLSQASGIDQDITFSVTGGTLPYQVVFRFKGLLNDDFSELTLSGDANNAYSASATFDLFDDFGLEFEIVATDAAGDTVKEPGKISKAIGEADSPLVPFERFGGTLESWNLFTIPYDLDDKSVLGIFSDLDPNRHEFDWRVMRYNNSTNEYFDFNNGNVKIGEAYWFNAKESITVNTGAGKVTTDIPFVMDLAKGWNLIGNPYDIAISWNQVLSDNGDPDGVGQLLIFSGVTQSVGNVMQPFSGGFVFADASTSVTIDPRTAAGGRRLNQPIEKIKNYALDKPEWILNIDLKTNSNVERIGGLGMHPEALASKDEFDQMAVPRFVAYSDLYTTHEEYFYTRFATDIVTTVQSHSWDFNLASNKTEGLSTLNWDHNALGKNEAQLILVDKQTGQLIDMKATGSYTVDLNNREFEFEILYSANQDIPISPQEAILGNAYPNPARTSTFIPLALPAGGDDVKVRLRVFDINGRQVRLLTNESMEPGFHQIEWDLTNDISGTVGRGLYIYRVEIDGQVLQKKLIVE